MIWIGGAPGAGKSTLAWKISRAYDLPLHPVDLWAYDHAGRLPPTAGLDDELAAGATRAADSFEADAARRLALVVEDVRARELGAVPALVEGPQLLPTFSGELPTGRGVWLVPDPAQTRNARAERLAAVPVDADRARLAALLGRDAVLADRTRTQALAAGQPVVDVPASPDWTAIGTAVEAPLGPALRTSPRLDAGPSLSTQRRFENGVASRQGQLWSAAVGLPDAPTFPFACECGRTRCAAVGPVTAVEYDTYAAGGPFVVHEHL